uniref:Uncharacterized protein n=1 Tax=Anguilla anguilla TaxID=7936 RepID=A0A0E9W7G0_ANGAN
MCVAFIVKCITVAHVPDNSNTGTERQPITAACWSSLDHWRTLILGGDSYGCCKALCDSNKFFCELQRSSRSAL